VGHRIIESTVSGALMMTDRICVAGRKVVRGLYNYEPCEVGASDQDDNDLCFNKGDVVVVIREYVL